MLFWAKHRRHRKKGVLERGKRAFHEKKVNVIVPADKKKRRSERTRNGWGWARSKSHRSGAEAEKRKKLC